MTRLLNVDEVELLLNLSLTAESNWHVILGSPDKEMFEKLNNLFENESMVLENYENGSDTLVEVAYKKPDLVILDENLTDISCEKIINSLKKVSGLRSIKIICAINDTINNQSPDWGADDYFIKFNMDKVYLSKKINSMLYTSVSDDTTGSKVIHSRKWPRINLDVTANIEFFEPENPEQTFPGEARVSNISHDGALLTDIRLDNGLNPSKSTHIKLRISDGPLRDLQAESIIVRLKDDEKTGVKFTAISKEDKSKINMLFD